MADITKRTQKRVAAYLEPGEALDVVAPLR
jgi:hypothetical protein